MELHQVYAQVATDCIQVIAEYNDHRPGVSTEIKFNISVERLPHKSFSSRDRAADMLSDDRALWALFENKTPQEVEESFLGLSVTYKELRKRMREVQRSDL